MRIIFQQLIKIKSLIIPYEYNYINESYLGVIKRNNYRKIKKNLYSWNNSYSNLLAFYQNEKIINKKKLKQNKIIVKLKYKISNFLSQDLSRKLLVPVLDSNYYMPNFREYDIKKLYQKKEDNSSENEIIYNIDLKEFSPKGDIILPKIIDQNYIIDEVCYIQTTHHIRGKIFMSKNPSIKKIFFSTNKTNNLLSKEESKKYDDYDSINNSCFGSIFRNNSNVKDAEIFLGINYNEIDFIFLRKYCFRNNSIEIYSNNHKSYYFKFEDDKKRNSFLDNIINKINKIILKKNIFKPMKGIDENNKTIIIGYFRDEDNNREYSNIININNLWKQNKISTLEYLMWINVYGNRSFRDIAQYPVFPWLLSNYESNNFENLIKEGHIRDLRLPMGMQSFDEKSKNRQEGYIEVYKMMVMDLYDENIIKLKKKEEDVNEEIPNQDNKNKRYFSKCGETDINLDLKLSMKFQSAKFNLDDLDSKSDNNENKAIVIINPVNNIIMNEIENEEIPKIVDYPFNIDKLYTNLNIEYEKIPYFYGSHFSNAAYVSHFLSRLFPYSLTMIEIQGTDFDCPERLFLNIQNSLYSSLTEKSDVREMIPELYTIPELFLNINNLNFGRIQITEETKGEEIEENKNNINTKINLEEDNTVQVEDVKLPSWCTGNPFLFIEKNRMLFESHNLNINPWIDLMFGYLQRGPKAQNIGNIYLPYVYDGVINQRVKPEDILKDREENEFKMRLFEMGVHPTKVFEKKCKTNKIKINNQIISISIKDKETNNILHELNPKSKINKIVYLSTNDSSPEELIIIDKIFMEYKLMVQGNKENNSFIFKDNVTTKDLTIQKIIEKNIEYKLIVRQIFKGKLYLMTGLFDGKLYIIKNINKTLMKKNEKEYYIINNKINQQFDKSAITCLEIDKNEKYIIYGTQKGSLVIYSLSYFHFKEGNNFIQIIKLFSSHPGYSINSLCINSDLHLFADCAHDGYAHIYSLPKCKLIHSIYIDSFSLDYVFLSAQPLAAIVLYSNKTYNFKCFSINGYELIQYNRNDDLDLIKKKTNIEIEIKEDGMISPKIITDSQFNDYLLYLFNKQFVLINKFPSMDNIVLISPFSSINEEQLSLVTISNDLRYIYIYEENNSKIYMLHHQNSQNNNFLHIHKDNKEKKEKEDKNDDDNNRKKTG